jgi:hypothetical protein
MSRESKPELTNAYEANAPRGIGAGGRSHPPPWPISRRGVKKKMLKIYERSRYVYENTQISGKVPGKKSGIYVLDSDIYV